MIPGVRTYLHFLRAVILTSVAVALSGCTVSEEPDKGCASDTKAVLTLKINLDNSSPRRGHASTRVGEEYEPDRQPANDDEKIHTVRIIIVDSSGVLEHNSLWDLTASPGLLATGQDFLVKADDTKDIILVANESNASIRLGDGTPMAAADYFRDLNPAVGQHVDVDEFRRLTYLTSDNATDGTYSGCMGGPLPMSAVHKYHIGTDTDHYSASFLIHRAAVKYTYRITNRDIISHAIDDIRINNVASRQYFFPVADFTDPEQYFFSTYSTPVGAGAREVTLEVRQQIAPETTMEVGPFYFPEGVVLDDRNPYGTGLTFDGYFSGWNNLKWAMPQTPENQYLMTDMPRNTHVIVNVTFTFTHFAIDYEVCPWYSREADIPSFN